MDKIAAFTGIGRWWLYSMFKDFERLRFIRFEIGRGAGDNGEPICWCVELFPATIIKWLSKEKEGVE